MEKQDLRKLLKELQIEINHTESVDEKGRELLSELDQDIHELLGRSRPRTPAPVAPMARRLEESIAYLEVTHPALTATLSQLLTALSNAGI